MRALITGSGNMGQAIAAALTARGDEVAAIAGRETGYPTADEIGLIDVVIEFSHHESLLEHIDLGLVDTFRMFEQEDRTWSWWDYRMNMFRRKMGLRIDLVLASKAMARRCSASYIDIEPRRQERPSDHAPAIAEFDNGDDIETPKGDIVPTRIDCDRYDLSYAYDNGSSEFMAFAGKLDTGETGTPALPMDIIYIDTELYGAQLGLDVADNVRIDGRLGYNDVAHVMDNFSVRQGPMAMRQRLNTTSGSGSQFFLAATFDNKGSSWQFGIDGIDAAHDSVITNPNSAMFRVDNFMDVERRLIGAFAELTRDLGDGELEVGARYNRVTTAAGEVGAAGMMGDMGDRVAELAQAFNAADRDLDWGSFDMVAKYRLQASTSTEWMFEFGSKSRAPSYQELYLWLPMQATGGLADGRTYIGNLDLEAERSNEVVVGLSTEIGRFAMSPQLYFRRIDDYILGVPSESMLANMIATMMSGTEPLQFDNVDAEIWGIDAAWSYELSDRLLLDGIVSLARGKRTDTNDHLYRLSPLNGSVGLTWAAEDWSLKSEVIGYADRDRVSVINNESSTPGYWLVNLGFRWTPLPALRVEARIDNLLDEAYQNHVTGINRARGSDIPVGERLWGAGRTLSAGLIYRF